MAKKGTANYHKALSFTTKKIDLETMSAKESGNTIEDAIEFVRVEMCKLHLKDNNAKKKPVIIDAECDDEFEDCIDVEDEYISSLKKENSNAVDLHSDTPKSLDNSSPNTSSTIASPEKHTIHSVTQSSSQPKSHSSDKNDQEMITEVIPPPQCFFCLGFHSSNMDHLLKKKKDCRYLKFLMLPRKL